MTRLTLRLPDSLHRRLAEAAEREDVSLNQYLVDVLAQGSASAYSVRPVPEDEVREQRHAYGELLDELGSLTRAELKAALDERAVVKPDRGLSPNLIEQLQARRVGSRAKRTSREKFEDALSRLPDVEPDEHDRL